MKQGVAGIVVGRNIIQHANPAGMTRALMALMQGNVAPLRRQRTWGPTNERCELKDHSIA